VNFTKLINFLRRDAESRKNNNKFLKTVNVVRFLIIKKY